MSDVPFVRAVRCPYTRRPPLTGPPPVVVDAAVRVLAGACEDKDRGVVWAWVGFPDGALTDRAAEAAARKVIEEAKG